TALLAHFAGRDDPCDEVQDPVGFGVGEVELAASDQSPGGTKRLEAVEHPGGGRQRGPVGDGLDGASDCGGQAFELLASDRWGVLFSAACGGDFAAFPDADLASADTGSDGELEL